jgi:hypothetical protein
MDKNETKNRESFKITLFKKKIPKAKAIFKTPRDRPHQA